MENTHWQSIRALRATPTGYADTDPDRRKIFVSSLRQAEELAEATRVAGYASKPLPLFYSLSQAGRAIAAAHLQDPWTLRGHGLRVQVKTPLLETTVEPTGRGGDSFRGVTEATGSPLLNGPAELGALWAANPDLRDVPIPTNIYNGPRALEIPISSQGIDPLGTGPKPTDPLHTGGIISVSIEVRGQTLDEITHELEPYATLSDTFVLDDNGRQATADDNINRWIHNGVEKVNVGIECPVETTFADYWLLQNRFASFMEIDTRYPRYPVPQFVGFAMPTVANGQSPHPMMLWWALLLGLSSLARYEPGIWTSAIDLDTSPLAVSLERVLDVATERIPQRILAHVGREYRR